MNLPLFEKGNKVLLAFLKSDMKITQVLAPFLYACVTPLPKQGLDYKSIHAFDVSSRGENDKNNKVRERVIASIINEAIPYEYYAINKWYRIRTEIGIIMKQIGGENYKSVTCVNKGGRKYNYDCDIKFVNDDNSEKVCRVELKFNAKTIADTPQWVSPMKPSQYMSRSFEEYFYDTGTYLPKLVEECGATMPSKCEYLAQIHGSKPKCVAQLQTLYYRGCPGSSKFANDVGATQFYELSNRLSQDSISTFISNTDLNIKALTEYLQSTQSGKIYMLYYEGKFIMQNSNIDDYEIVGVTKNPVLFRYDCVSRNGKNMKVLLRWKNGNGIAFPAFQIS